MEQSKNEPIGRHNWIRQQLVLKYRGKRDVSIFLELRDIHQCQRNHEQEIRKNNIVIDHTKFADLGSIKY